MSNQSEYSFFRCATLITINLEGLPIIDGIHFQDSFKSCGTGYPVKLEPTHDIEESDEQLGASFERMPTISVTAQEDGFEIEVIRLDTTPPIRYRGVKLGETTHSIALTSDSAGAPKLRVSIEPAREGSHVGILATNVEATRLIDELTRQKAFNFRNASLLQGTNVTLHFDEIASLNLVHLLADASDVSVRSEGPSTYTFGRAANAAAIEALRVELAALPQTGSGTQRISLLQTVIALSKPEQPGEFPSNVGFELQELSELALKEKDYARAEMLVREWIGQIEFFANSEGSSALGVAQLDLGHVLRLESKTKAAGQSLRRSLQQLDQYGDSESQPARARAYAEIAILEVESGNFEQASKLLRQAYIVFENIDLPNWDAHQIYLARRILADVAGNVALRYQSTGDLATAEVHLEKSLIFSEGAYGQDDPLTDNPRLLVIANLKQQNKAEHAVAFQVAQIRASMSRDDPLSPEYVFAMQGVILHLVSQENFSAATKLWSRYAEVLKSSSELHENVQISVLWNLALLKRFSGKVAEAQVTERKAEKLALSPAGVNAGAHGSSSLAEIILNESVARALAVYYGNIVKTLRRSDENEEPFIILAQWREMESLVAHADMSHALLVSTSLRVNLKRSRDKLSPIANRVADRVNKLCVRWKNEVTPQAIPHEVCPLSEH